MGEKGSFRFKREERLKGRNEIREVFKSGRRFSCPGVKLFVLKNALPRSRICFTFSRGGNAVQRNRARRLAREAYRLLKPRLLSGYDLVLLLFRSNEDGREKVLFSFKTSQIEFLFKKAGLLK
jgi:ribonuclease P protein component